MQGGLTTETQRSQRKTIQVRNGVPSMLSRHVLSTWPALCLFSLCTLCLCGSTSTADPAKPTYADDVLPVFKQHCTNCHGNDKQKSDLNLATFAALSKGGSSG